MLRYVFRTLLKSPVFTAVAVLSLALGIGANTAIFSLLDQILLRSLPVRDPAQLVMIKPVGGGMGNVFRRDSLSYPMYADFRDRTQGFQGVLCSFQTPVSISFRGQTERIEAELVSGNYFDVLGVGAILGRAFTPDDDRQPGAHPLVMLSYGYWKSRFAGNPAIVGQTIHVNSYAMTVLGVSPEGFSGAHTGRSPQIRVPVMMQSQMVPDQDPLFSDRRSSWLRVFARLKSGVTREQAQAPLRVLYKQIVAMEVKDAFFARVPPYGRQKFLESTVNLEPAAKGYSDLRRRFSKPLTVLMATVGFVLLIACANVANLLIARAAARQKEIAVRLALGARRRHILRQLVAESLVLSFAGGALGLAFASWTSGLLLRFLPESEAPLTIAAGLDARVLAFAFGLSLLTGILFGLAPALESTHPNVAGVLKSQATAAAGGGQAGFRRALVVAQVALSILLLIGAGLFVRSLRNLRDLDPGFRTDHVISFSVDPSLSGYGAERSRAFYRQLIENLRGTPGVRAVGLASNPVLRDATWMSTITVEGYQYKPGEDMNPAINSVSPGWIDAMGIKLLAGRDFNPRDAGDKRTVVLVNETFARYYFGGHSPVGRHIGRGGPMAKPDIEIVGVVQDAKYDNLRQPVPREVFLCSGQDKFPTEMTAYVRTALDPALMFTALRREVRKIDGNLPLFQMKSLQVTLEESLKTERVVAALSAAFGVLATLLAIIGLYGVMAYTVARRSREIGIRMALGAGAPGIVRMVMREAGRMIGIGLAIGLPVAVALAQLVQSQLYGMRGFDPATLAGASLTLSAIALLAAYVPARRAARVDPVEVLRYE